MIDLKLVTTTQTTTNSAIRNTITTINIKTPTTINIIATTSTTKLFKTTTTIT